MRTMEMLEAATTPAAVKQVKKVALARGWTPALFDKHAAPVLKRVAKLQRPKEKAAPVTPKLVEALGTFTVRVIPAMRDADRTPLVESAVERTAEVRRVQGKFKVRVAIGPRLVSERAWQVLKEGGMVRTWLGPKGKESMHYLQLV